MADAGSFGFYQSDEGGSYRRRFNGSCQAVDVDAKLQDGPPDDWPPCKASFVIECRVECDEVVVDLPR